MGSDNDAIEPLIHSLDSLLEADRLYFKAPASIDLQQIAVSGRIILLHAKAQCPRTDRQLYSIEQRLAELERISTPPSGLHKLIGALIRIGVAAIAGAAIGAPIGAWLVSDEATKEVVKAAVAATVSQTCMEVAEAGLGRPWIANSASRPSEYSAFRINDRAQEQSQEAIWGWEHGSNVHAAGDDDARAR
jgi:hypothetical protein